MGPLGPRPVRRGSRESVGMAVKSAVTPFFDPYNFERPSAPFFRPRDGKNGCNGFPDRRHKISDH